MLLRLLTYTPPEVLTSCRPPSDPLILDGGGKVTGAGAGTGASANTVAGGLGRGDKSVTVNKSGDSSPPRGYAYLEYA